MQIEQAIEALATTGDYRILRRVKPLQEVLQIPQLSFGLALDVETTGLNHKTDTVIEFAAARFQYDRIDGHIYGVQGRYSTFIDPGCDIPAEITDITCITNEMVRGCTFEGPAIDGILEGAALVVAHNAAFDRPF